MGEEAAPQREARRVESRREESQERESRAPGQTSFAGHDGEPEVRQAEGCAERMLAFNTPTQAVANRIQRILRERSGQQPWKNRSGAWGKDSANADKIVAELAAR